nr:YafY family protein [Maliibacterium massiliense]
MQVHRLFGIIYALMQTPCITSRALAERFEVSVRTIRRDIEVLSGMGIPIYTRRGAGGGVCLMEGYVLDAALLSNAEKQEILMGLEGLSATQGSQEAALLSKMRALFHQQGEAWIEVDFSHWGGGEMAQAAFARLKEGILQQRLVHFTYYDAAGRTTQRSVAPLQLWFKGQAWYLKAHCMLRGAIRLFRVTRMQDITVSEQHFAREDYPQADGPVDVYAAPHTGEQLRLRFAPEAAYRLYDTFMPEQIAPRQDGGFDVAVTFPLDAWVYGFLLSFGEALQEVEPAHVRKELARRMRAALARWE